MSRFTNRLLARVFTALPSLAARWGETLKADHGRIPWVQPSKPLSQATLALVTTGGVHLTTALPFDMKNPEGDASWREVPLASPRENLTITHDYYDHQDAEKDLNLVFPVERLQELLREGAVGALYPLVASLMGHIDGRQLDTLRRETAPAIAARLAAAGVDYALLVPA